MKNKKNYFYTLKKQTLYYTEVSTKSKIAVFFLHGLMSDISGKKVNYLKSICKKHNIPNPDSYISKSKDKLYILKDRFGCGSSHVELLNKVKKDVPRDKILENYIPGKSYSISLYLGKNNYKLISINEQKIRRNNNILKLKSLNVNVYPSFKDNIFYFINNILLALPKLKGFIGLDIIYNDGKLFLIEINARYTTSMSVIQKCKNHHILDYIDPLLIDKTGMSCQINF